MCKTAINMEQRTVTIKNFLRIENPDIHYRRMTYPPERVRTHLTQYITPVILCGTI